MGNKNSKSSFRNALIYLNISAEPVKVHDDKFWNQIWSEDMGSATTILSGISNREIRMLRDGSPKNFATLAYKMVERLYLVTSTLCNTQSQQTAVMNATRILIRIIPCMFEDSIWRNFFHVNHMQAASLNGSAYPLEPTLIVPQKNDHQRNYSSYLPPGINVDEANAHDLEEDQEDCLLYYKDIDNGDSAKSVEETRSAPSAGVLESKSTCVSLDDKGGDKRTLLECLVLYTCDLLFCPEFTVSTHVDNYLYLSVDAPPEDLKSLSTCDYVWEPGVGFYSSANSTTYYDKSRSELLRLLLTCFSITLYEKSSSQVNSRNYWIETMASSQNRHALPLFTSLLNIVFIYKPSKLMPFKNLIFEDNREELVELAIQVLIVILDYQFDYTPVSSKKSTDQDKRNLFVDYMSRIHKTEDFIFIVKGFTRLLYNRIAQGYLLQSSKTVNFEQELLIMFWRICNLNSNFVEFLLKTTDILDIVISILYHLNENFQNSTKSALIHICVFNLLILSGERNFGVALNKAYTSNILQELPTFTGSHADLMIIVFHKLILYGQNLNQVFDFLLTILVNISPYLKSLSMLASKCLIQIFEIFSSPMIIFTEPNYHLMVVFMLEIFNNLIQYQFDGNTNLIFMIMTRKEAFIELANLTESAEGIQKVLNKLLKKMKRMQSIENQHEDQNSISSRIKVDAQINQNFDFSNASTGATISAERSPSTPSISKQEVSLIPTPDIYHVTQAVHPSDRNNNNLQIFFGPGSSTDSPSIDDILSNDSGSIATKTATKPPVEGLKFDSNNKQDSSLKTNVPQLSLIDEIDKLVVDSSEKSSEHKVEKKWKPTPEWVQMWKKSLPLHTTLRMIEVLSRQFEHAFGQEHSGQRDDELMRFIQNSTLVGLLPVPHPILIRKYHTNNETTIWFRSCTWGIIYVRNTIWMDTNIKLIKII